MGCVPGAKRRLIKSIGKGIKERGIKIMSFKGRQSAYKRMRFLPKTGEKRMAMIKELELTRDKERACIDDPILFLLTINKKKKPNKKYEKIIASFVDDRELAPPCGYSTIIEFI